MDSRKRQALKDRLREGDPAQDHPELDASRAADLKANILRQAVQPAIAKAVLWPNLAKGFALIAAVTLLLLWQASPRSLTVEKAIQTATNDAGHFQNLRETRLSELHFTTPGGTRIIWQFRSDALTDHPEKTSK